MYIESLLQKKSVNFICKFFSCIKSKFSASYSFFLISNVKCVKSASQKDITDAMSFQLHVDIYVYITNILNHFQLLKIMVIEGTCIRVKDLDLYIIETECKFMKIFVILLCNIKTFYLN